MTPPTGPTPCPWPGWHEAWLTDRLPWRAKLVFTWICWRRARQLYAATESMYNRVFVAQVAAGGDVIPAELAAAIDAEERPHLLECRYWHAAWARQWFGWGWMSKRCPATDARANTQRVRGLLEWMDSRKLMPKLRGLPFLTDDEETPNGDDVKH